MKRKRLFLIILFIVAAAALGLGFWTAHAESRAHYTPEYGRLDLSRIINKDELSEEDYETLFLQTGLTKSGVETLYAEGRREELYYLQERFFAEVAMECLRDNLIVQSERLVDDGVQVVAQQEDGGFEAGEAFFLPDVETGDILISFSGHIFGWRSGHAAIVVDGENGVTLEALTLGVDTKLCSLERWQEYPCFALLRLKGVSEEERGQIAEYAEANLVGIPYRLLVFGSEMVEGEADEILSGTHCAHLVWQAFMQFGYNLDSDGGLIVTPRDLYESDLLEVVQVYGLDPLECPDD